MHVCTQRHHLPFVQGLITIRLFRHALMAKHCLGFGPCVFVVTVVMIQLQVRKETIIFARAEYDLQVTINPRLNCSLLSVTRDRLEDAVIRADDNSTKQQL